MHRNLSVYGDVHVDFFSLHSESTEVENSPSKIILFTEVLVKDKTNTFALLQGLSTDSIYFIFFRSIY